MGILLPVDVANPSAYVVYNVNLAVASDTHGAV